MKTFQALAAIIAVSLSLSGSAAHSAEARKSITVEFNDLQPADKGCRAVFVLQNGLDQPLDKLALRVVAFDGEQHAKLFLSLDVGSLPAGKTRILRFDLGEGLACTDIGRLVLDDVTNCDGKDMTPQRCLELMKLSSRAGVPIDY